jgi:hypothetical protein
MTQERASGNRGSFLMRDRIRAYVCGVWVNRSGGVAISLDGGTKQTRHLVRLVADVGDSLLRNSHEVTDSNSIEKQDPGREVLSG